MEKAVFPGEVPDDESIRSPQQNRVLKVRRVRHTAGLMSCKNASGKTVGGKGFSPKDGKKRFHSPLPHPGKNGPGTRVRVSKTGGEKGYAFPVPGTR